MYHIIIIIFIIITASSYYQFLLNCKYLLNKLPTKLTYIHYPKSPYIQFSLPTVTGTKPNKVLVYKQQTHSTPSIHGGSLSS